MAEHGFRNFFVDTSVGRAGYAAVHPHPRVLILHGFYRSAYHLLAWRSRIPDLGFLHLPGHSGAPTLRDVSLETWIRGFGELVATFPEPPALIAESLGAIVAMGLPSRAVIAVEPPLSVDQLWPLHQTLARARARGMAIDPALEALFAHPFHWILERITAPTLVLAGDEPLLPPRPTPREPSLLVEADFAAYAGHPLVEARRIPGGHALLDHSADEVMAAAGPFMRRHGYFDAAANST